MGLHNPEFVTEKSKKIFSVFTYFTINKGKMSSDKHEIFSLIFTFSASIFGSVHTTLHDAVTSSAFSVFSGLMLISALRHASTAGRLYNVGEKQPSDEAP